MINVNNNKMINVNNNNKLNIFLVKIKHQNKVMRALTSVLAIKFNMLSIFQDGFRTQSNHIRHLLVQ